CFIFSINLNSLFIDKLPQLKQSSRLMPADGTYFPCSWKVGKEPRLADISCKSSFILSGRNPSRGHVRELMKVPATLLRIAIMQCKIERKCRRINGLYGEISAGRSALRSNTCKDLKPV